MGAPRNEMKTGHYGAGDNHMAGDGLDGARAADFGPRVTGLRHHMQHRLLRPLRADDERRLVAPTRAERAALGRLHPSPR